MGPVCQACTYVEALQGCRPHSQVHALARPVSLYRVALWDRLAQNPF